MLKPTYTSDDGEMNNGDSKSTVLEITIKN